MIPAVIHYTWFSDEIPPEKIKKCIESWMIRMPNMEIVHWDMAKISVIDSVFLREAIKAKKWAFASDYVRLWVLYNYGGVYLDTDVECYKSMDDLLKNKCFIGKESSIHINGRLTEYYLTSHCMGAEAGHPYIKMCLDYYEGRHFITSDHTELPQWLRFDMTLLPYIQSEIAKLWGYCPYPSANNIQSLKDGLIIYPSDYFDCTTITPTSYCKHLAVGSWRPTRIKDEKITFGYKIRWRIRKIIEYIMDANGYFLTKKL